MALFVVLHDGVELDDALRSTIKQQIRTALSPRHLPDAIFAVPDVPRTINGKKLEVPVKKILLGTPLDQAANPDSMANPQSLQVFVALAEQRAAQKDLG
jgi:acetoacetyl-CoA synthetase